MGSLFSRPPASKAAGGRECFPLCTKPYENSTGVWAGGGQDVSPRARNPMKPYRNMVRWMPGMFRPRALHPLKALPHIWPGGFRGCSPPLYEALYNPTTISAGGGREYSPQCAERHQFLRMRAGKGRYYSSMRTILPRFKTLRDPSTV